MLTYSRGGETSLKLPQSVTSRLTVRAASAIYQQLTIPLLQNLEVKGIKNYMVMLENSDMVKGWEKDKSSSYST